MKNRAKIESVNRIAEAAFSGFFKNDQSAYLAYTSVKTGFKGLKWEGVACHSQGTVRERVGSRVVNRAAAIGIEIDIKPYDKTDAFEGLLMRQDKSGVIAEYLANFFAGHSGYYDKLAFDTLIAGQTALAYDAVAFFSDAHVEGSNLGTSAFSATALDTTCQAIESRLGPDGESLGIKPATLIVGPKNRKAAMEALNYSVRAAAINAAGAEATASVLAAATTANAFKDYNLNLVVDARLVGDYDDYWFVIGEKGAEKPIILVEATAPNPKVWEDEMNDEVLHALDADLGLGYGMWQLAYAHIS